MDDLRQRQLSGLWFLNSRLLSWGAFSLDFAFHIENLGVGLGSPGTCRHIWGVYQGCVWNKPHIFVFKIYKNKRKG